MRIVCPSCGVSYQVPEALLAKRQTLKCSACGTKWHIHAPAPQPPAPASITDAPAHLPTEQTPPQPDVAQPEPHPAAVPQPDAEPTQPEPAVET
ncbi:MAG: zinc-ribbon domain-containing protein, partial [Acetobacter cibinongensis]